MGFNRFCLQLPWRTQILDEEPCTCISHLCFKKQLSGLKLGLNWSHFHVFVQTYFFLFKPNSGFSENCRTTKLFLTQKYDGESWEWLLTNQLHQSSSSSLKKCLLAFTHIEGKLSGRKMCENSNLKGIVTTTTTNNKKQTQNVSNGSLKAQNECNAKLEHIANTYIE